MLSQTDDNCILNANSWARRLQRCLGECVVALFLINTKIYFWDQIWEHIRQKHILSAGGLSIKGTRWYPHDGTTSRILQTSVGPRIVLFTDFFQRQRAIIRISSPGSRSSLCRGQFYAFPSSRPPSLPEQTWSCSLERSIHIQRKHSLFLVRVTGNEVFLCFHAVISPLSIFVNASWAPMLFRIQAVCGVANRTKMTTKKRRRLWTSEFTVIQRSKCIGTEIAACTVRW